MNDDTNNQPASETSLSAETYLAKLEKLPKSALTQEQIDCDEAGKYNRWSDLQEDLDSDLLAALEHDGNVSDCQDIFDDMTDEDIDALFGNGNHLSDDSDGDYPIIGDDDFVGDPLVDLDKIIASMAQDSVESYLPDNSPIILSDLLGNEKAWRIRFNYGVGQN